MPRRKITLEEAAAAFEQAGLRVVVQAIEPDPVIPPFFPETRKNPYDESRPVKTDNLNDVVQVTLFTKHTIGSGGYATGDPKQPTVQGNSYETYGPGLCWIPKRLASDILHNDMMAKREEERFQDNTPKNFIVGAYIDGNGREIFRGIRVDNTRFADAMSVNSFHQGSI